MIQVKMHGQPARLYPEEITWGQIAEEAERPDQPIMGAWSNDQVHELGAKLKKSCEGRFLNLCDLEGYRIYVRTLIYVYIVCAKQVLGQDKRVVILHSLGGNLYSEIRNQEETIAVSAAEVKEIQEQMRRMVAGNRMIRKETHLISDALGLFEEQQQYDKQSLFHYRSSSNVNLYQLEQQYNYFYGGMLPSTGKLRWFDLQPYEEGIILITPRREKEHRLRTCTLQPKLFGVFQQAKEWGRILEAENVGALNAAIASGRIENLIQTSEALHAKQISEMASRITASSDIKLILVAGPSSSGKTTFAQKLGIQLQAEGRRPHLISMDNYFINRAEVPYGPDGLQDFEALQAVDTELFNAHMELLLQGERIDLPTYNFKTGKREFNGETLQLGEEDVLIVEGIHCLNEAVSSRVPHAQKFKIYISAITMLNIDDHNRIPTTDGRLLRRMVRDYLHRATSAAETIHRWQSVRNGEEKNIFPFQEEADAIFNSAHIYELAVLKTYAEPLLYKIQRGEPEYSEARRLIKFLNYFLGVSSELVPEMSIIREFIGGGIYRQ